MLQYKTGFIDMFFLNPLQCVMLYFVSQGAAAYFISVARSAVFRLSFPLTYSQQVQR